MTDNEIIKACEVCACVHGKSCAPCPYYAAASAAACLQMKKDVLDLINRQQAEIGRLTNIVERNQETQAPVVAKQNQSKEREGGDDMNEQEQRFCDSCRYYDDPDCTGEGHCKALGMETWNGEYACEDYCEDGSDEDGAEAMC